ncbi:hypothetical protein EV659_102102 [Rhodothalassium salexigens DSM 2132]|uniref:HAD family hydrolase n=1 Tax=Rhodothalassium salexigens DSM 2132 TaxID=1188247 RepID=A0A4V2SQ49_RHOSA|nr:hypothetical protein [Rhodothalassium salexigens]MBB4210748.1 hypothetical protein [Rhodothalassium salexigens DSM 2132]MBK1638271.1 hypothetical protein [Rhodothalassium salexigens DSM 2132]TCP37696.1 hypothetical protein EV659_102102 [Rhodothalassium salexigens DSM 2132]
MSLAPPIADQIVRLPVDADRPLLICDADEVLVQFAVTLERFLDDAGFTVRFDSFRLSGNVRHADSGAVADDATVHGLIARFFDERVADCPPVDGAVEALAQLSRRTDIVVLSNVPMAARAARERAMAAQGFAYPLVANAGPKGPAVAALVAGRRAPCLFLDDLPGNIASVADAAPPVHRIHFVADPRLARLIGPADGAHARIDRWADAGPYIDRHMTDAGF